MAYAFDKITNALNGSDNKTDIFNNEGGFGLTGGGGSGSPTAGLGSSTAGDLSPLSGSAGATTTPKVYNAQPVSTAAQNKSLSKNRGLIKSPVDLGKLNTSITGAQDSLKKEADSYVNSADDMYETLPTDKQLLDYAHTGSTKAPGSEPYPSEYAGGGFKDLQSYVDTKTAPKQPDWLQLYEQGTPTAPDPFKKSTNTVFDEVGLINNAAGVGQLFKRAGDAEYSRGENAFDTSLLSSDPSFLTGADAVQKNYAGLQNYDKEVGANINPAALQSRTNALSTFQSGVKDKAQSTLATLDDEQQTDINNQKKSAENEGYGGFVPQAEKEFQSILATLPPDQQAEASAWWDSLKSDPKNLAQFVNGRMSDEDLAKLGNDEFRTDEGIKSFNRIQGLIGRGTAQQPGSFKGRGGTFDPEKFKQSFANRPKGTVGVLPGEGANGSGSGAGSGSFSDNNNVPITIGTDKSKSTDPKDITVQTPYGPVTVSPGLEPPTKGEAIDIGRDMIDPVTAMNREISRVGNPFELPGMDSTTAGKTYNGLKSITTPSSPIASIAPPSMQSFPNLSNALGDGGRSSTYQGNQQVADSINGLNIPLEPVNNGPAPIVPNTPTVPDFSGAYGSGYTGVAPDKPKDNFSAIRRFLRR